VLLLFGWTWLFWVNIPIMLLIIGLGVRLLPVGGGNATAPFDWLGAGVLSIMLVCAAIVLQEMGTMLAQPQWTLTPLAVGAGIGLLVSIAMFVPVERRALDPIIQLDLFARRQILLILAFAFGAGIAEAVTLYVPSLLVSAHGMSESTASFQLLPLVVAMAVASPLSGRMLDTRGAKPVVMTGVIVMAIGLCVLGWWPTQMSMYYLFSILFGLGIAVLLGAALRYMMLGETVPSQRAPAQALLTITISVGQMIGAAMMGAIAGAQADATTGYALAMLVTAYLMCGLVVLGIWLKPAVQPVVPTP
jgi:predicted MFS family arabinose efflux permease